MTITEEQLKDNPKLAALVQKAVVRDGKTNGFYAKQIIIDEMYRDYKPTNKYHVSNKADRTYKDGTLFASKAEMERWDYLLNIQRAGEIKDLEMQVPFLLQEGFIHPQYGKIEPVIYVADFTYTNVTFRKDLPDRKIVEDSKTGLRTNEYKIKRKLFLRHYTNLLFYEV